MLPRIATSDTVDTMEKVGKLRYLFKKLIQSTVFSRLNAGPRINAGTTGPSLKKTPPAFI